MSLLHEISIPECYLWMTEGADNRKQLFTRYVGGYIEKNYPDLKLISIKGMTAICEVGR